MSDYISQELAQRMAAVIRAYTAGENSMPLGRTVYSEALSIVAELPAPIDPDMEEARILFIKHYPGAGYERAGAKELAAGLECIKRGRELAQEQP